MSIFKLQNLPRKWAFLFHLWRCQGKKIDKTERIHDIPGTGNDRSPLPVQASGLRVPGPRASGLRVPGPRAPGLRAPGPRASGPMEREADTQGGRAVSGAHSACCKRDGWDSASPPAPSA